MYVNLIRVFNNNNKIIITMMMMMMMMIIIIIIIITFMLGTGLMRDIIHLFILGVNIVI